MNILVLLSLCFIFTVSYSASADTLYHTEQDSDVSVTTDTSGLGFRNGVDIDAQSNSTTSESLITSEAQPDTDDALGINPNSTVVAHDYRTARTNSSADIDGVSGTHISKSANMHITPKE